MRPEEHAQMIRACSSSKAPEGGPPERENHVQKSFSLDADQRQRNPAPRRASTSFGRAFFLTSLLVTAAEAVLSSPGSSSPELSPHHRNTRGLDDDAPRMDGEEDVDVVLPPAAPRLNAPVSADGDPTGPTAKMSPSALPRTCLCSIAISISS